MGTLIVGVILIVIVAAIVRSMIKDKKNGKGCGDCSHCGGGCGGGQQLLQIETRNNIIVSAERRKKFSIY